MMRYRNQLRVEELCARISPSATTLTAPVGGAFPSHAAHHDVSVAGHGSGTYTPVFINPDVGREFQLQGQGQMKDLGQVTVHGSLKAPGFIRNGHYTGTVTFANAHGSVTIELTGPTQSDPSAVPCKFQYKVTSATGSYQGAHGQGTMQLSLTPTQDGQGTFTFKIH